ncbi:anthranilate synthase component I family protein [Sinobaca sp. H24]|uniref:anthranilate synthase component I family protein n=1 Tax=Sinobaca sp. H24 TaxID=2923376 RepID=UPI002079F820|nr:anthranilate synthase component I family protein [Sinobaca sp. H24]
MEPQLASLPAASAAYRVSGRSIDFPEARFFSAYASLSRTCEYHVILESGQRGRYSIAALHPFALFTGKDNHLTVQTAEEAFHITGDPLLQMKEWMKTYAVETVPDFPDFQGGLFGFISYDYIRYIEQLEETTADDLDTPDCFFQAFQEAAVYDHEKKKLWVLRLAGAEENDEDKLDQMMNNWLTAVEEDPSADAIYEEAGVRERTQEASWKQAEFSEAVEQVKEYIAQGDVFQVNLSLREGKPLRSDPFDIYRKLREINPSPYMGYFHTPDFQLVNGSPELLIKKRGREASTRPIAGTRSRGMDEKADHELGIELLTTEKERAEHIMLVDLERNDLGRVCQFGSVEVDELMVIERYSHVMHIVSNVKGVLADDMDVYDMIRAAFPGGTITGAPKVRTMEIIEELEQVRRGVYTGSIGWIGYNGDTELNIAIRTMITKNGMAYVQAGAGIVIDSHAEAEFKECLKKAKALWTAKELSEEEMSRGGNIQ